MIRLTSHVRVDVNLKNTKNSGLFIVGTIQVATGTGRYRSIFKSYKLTKLPLQAFIFFILFHFIYAK